MLFAQAGTEIVAWTSVVTSVVNMGFSALVAWYLLTKSLPTMQEKFSASLKEEREIFMAAELRRTSDSKEKLAAVFTHCERESARRDTILSSEMSIVNKSLGDVGEVMEEVRDYLRTKNHNA